MHKKSIITIMALTLLFMSGCGQKEDKKSEEKVAKASEIKVTKDVVNKDVKKEDSKANNGQFYYSYNKEGESEQAKNIEKYNSESSKVRTTMDAYLHIKSPYERIKITLMIQKLSHDYVVKCSSCHDDYANGIIGPSLLDKDADFIYGRIMAFKSGKKKNILMKELIAQISDEKLKEIAVEIADFNTKIRKMRDSK